LNFIHRNLSATFGDLKLLYSNNNQVAIDSIIIHANEDPIKIQFRLEAMQISKKTNIGQPGKNMDDGIQYENKKKVLNYLHRLF
jgi:hypothetical protein